MSNISQAIKAICDEKGIPYESVLETVKAALAAAYRKDFGNKLQNIQAEFDPETGKLEVFDVKTVVEDVPEEELLEMQNEGEEDDKKYKEQATLRVVTPRVKNKKTKEEDVKKVEKKETSGEESHSAQTAEDTEEKKRFNPKTEIQIKDAKALKKSSKIGDVIRTELEVPGEFGRMAAQTAKQVIIQKLREAERDIVLSEYKSREDSIINGVVQRREGRLVLVDLGRATALLPPEEQIPRESSSLGEHLKVYVVSVNKTTKGPEIIVSRAHPNIVRKFFEMEIPEIANGTVQIKAVAREAGSRTKIAVWTDNENIDPIGSCIGQRGARVQTIISELKGEKIDIIEYDEDPQKFIAHALSPAKISNIELDKENMAARVKVPEDQLSLAIGKNGQNVRLAAKLTGWRLDIVTDIQKPAEASVEEKTTETEEKPSETQEKEKQEIEETTPAEVEKKSEEKKSEPPSDEKEEKKKEKKEKKKTKKKE